MDFFQQRAQPKQSTSRTPLDFPVISVGEWPEDLSLRRGDMYGSDEARASPRLPRGAKGWV